MQGHPVYTLRYTSSRKEIWHWYWRAWAKPNGLWRYHALIALLMAAFRAEAQGLHHFRPTTFVVTVLIWMAACTLFSSLWPQVRFKSAERTLLADPAGWSTQIGNLSGTRSWSDVQGIEDKTGAIYIVGRNRNALIIPARAFDGEETRRRFLTDIQRWHQSATGRCIG